MAIGFGAVTFNGVCKCENPKINIQGYTHGRMKSQPIYYCYNCRHQFKSNSKKWEEIAKRKGAN